VAEAGDLRQINVGDQRAGATRGRARFIGCRRLKIERFLDLRQPALAIGGARSWRRSNGADAACAAPIQSNPLTETP